MRKRRRGSGTNVIARVSRELRTKLRMGVFAAGLLIALGACVCAHPVDPGVVSSAAAQVASTHAAAVSGVALFAAPTRLDRIGRIVAPVMINGQGPFRFIIDSGASHSTVTPRLASLLGLDPAASELVLVDGVTGTAQLPSVPIAALQAGSLEIRDTQFPVVAAPVLGDVDGMLGVAGLRQDRIHVDFQRDRVTISHSYRQGAPSGFAMIKAERIAGGLLAIPAKISGVGVEAIIDTGSPRTLGNTALRAALQGRRSHGRRPAATATVYGATAQTCQGWVEDAPPIFLGSVVVARLSVIYGDFHIFRVWNLEQRPTLIIGMDVIGTMRALAIDFKESKVYLDAGNRDATAIRAAL